MPPATVPPRKPASATYMPQLDGLRALAVFGVLVTHIYYTGEGNRFPWGYLGVRLLLVVSGFLITGILLDCKALMEAHQQSLGFTLRRFYIRRALRILPPFYLAVAAVSIAGLYHMRQMIPWHLVHVCNFYYAYQGRWPHPGLHFWSLAVEEQFYFLWPCLILIVRREHLQRFILITIALGPIYRAAACAAGFN